MRDPSVFLCSEITREKAFVMIKWLNDPEVTRYLSDSPYIADYLLETLQRVNLPIVTHLFNQNGRFYLVEDQDRQPIGFVRLVKKASDYELVIVIGERRYWHKRYGTKTIKEALKIAFLELRARKVTAKIYPDNQISLRAFKRAAFLTEQRTARLITMSMNMEQYFQSLKMFRADPDDIIMTNQDKTRLLDVMQNRPFEPLMKLKTELERAIIVDSQQITEDVITMNSRILLTIDTKPLNVQLVYPQDASAADTLPVTDPIGTAVLGFRAGKRLNWELPDGPAQIFIQQILYQPEASGDYRL